MPVKIMVVDDEKEIRDLLKDFLVKKGFEVITASTANEAIEKLKSRRPRIVLLDIRMPDLSGMEALKRIRELDKAVNVIMATAVRDEETARESIRCGAAGYIVKPFDLEYLEKSLLSKIAFLK